MSTNRMPALLLAALLAGGTAAAAGTEARAQDGSYTLGKVTFQGNEKVPTAELMAALPIQPGQTITRAGIQDETNAVGAAYTRHNVGASISSRATMQNHRLSLSYAIAEKAPVAPQVRHIGNVADNVSVQGNQKISTAAILAAAKIQPGSPVTSESLQAAQGAIVGLYKARNIGVQVGTDFTGAGQPGHVNIVFKVQEKADES